MTAPSGECIISPSQWVAITRRECHYVAVQQNCATISQHAGAIRAVQSLVRAVPGQDHSRKCQAKTIDASTSQRRNHRSDWRFRMLLLGWSQTGTDVTRAGPVLSSGRLAGARAGSGRQ